MIAFGPIPSRRLGASLGINNIPPKSCSYDCLYCQVGRTNNREFTSRSFYEVDQVVTAVQKRVSEVEVDGVIDYLSFVPDGEPTLDINLGREIELLKKLPYKIAVITNGSMLGRESVRRSLADVDLVSVKVDSVEEITWHKINRPHPFLKLNEILMGMEEFASNFQGELITETMLLAGINDGEAQVEAVAEFLQKIRPSRAYITIPTRPTAQKNLKVCEAETLMRAYMIFARYLDNVELLTGFSEEEFRATGKPVDELLNITAVHPMRRAEALKLLENTGSEVETLNRLVEEGTLLCIDHEGETFFLRKHQSVND